MYCIEQNCGVRKNHLKRAFSGSSFNPIFCDSHIRWKSSLLNYRLLYLENLNVCPWKLNFWIFHIEWFIFKFSVIVFCRLCNYFAYIFFSDCFYLIRDHFMFVFFPYVFGKYLPCILTIGEYFSLFSFLKYYWKRWIQVFPQAVLLACKTDTGARMEYSGRFLVSVFYWTGLHKFPSMQ